MKTLVLSLALLLVGILVEGQPCAPAPTCSASAYIIQDSCPPSPQQVNVLISAISNTVCANNLPTVAALSGATCTWPDNIDCPATNVVSASVYTPLNVSNPMNTASVQSVYVSLDTISGFNTYACGADIKLWLKSPAGTWIMLTSTRPFNDGSQPNHYKPTFTVAGTDGVLPNADVSYNLCNYAPENGWISFTGENPYANGGEWKLYMNDNTAFGGCTDSARITEFCITFITYPPTSSLLFTWSADSANWLSYLSDTTILNPVFTPPSGYYDITYYVTVTDTVTGCTASDTLHVSCPSSSAIESLNGSANALQVSIHNSEITFTYPSSNEKKEIAISDIRGREIIRYKWQQGSTMLREMLPQMSKGVYVARLISNFPHYISNVKFVIQ
jgi:hypothetical protein